MSASDVWRAHTSISSEYINMILARLVATGAALIVGASANLLHNGDFEEVVSRDYPLGWDALGYVLPVGHTTWDGLVIPGRGNHVFKLNYFGTPYIRQTLSTPVTPSKTYRLSFLFAAGSDWGSCEADISLGHASTRMSFEDHEMKQFQVNLTPSVGGVVTLEIRGTSEYCSGYLDEVSLVQLE